MPEQAIVFTDFGLGQDHIKSASVADVNRLRRLKNGHVTKGKAIAKRPGTSKVATIESGTRGLVAAEGKLKTFYESGSITHANTLFEAVLADHGTVTTAVKKVHAADMFDGFLYAAIEYENGDVKHHYFDGGSPTRITDANNPNSKSFKKMEEKIFAIDGNVVRYSATGLPRNWTLAGDAGFLSTGRQQQGAENALALGQFQRKGLVVFHIDGSQVWNVDPDPSLMVFQQLLPATQTRYPRTIINLFNDLVYLSDDGFRTISESILSDNKAELDIGSPVDDTVTPILTAGANPISAFFSKQGQYHCAIGSRMFVFTQSKSAKIAAWSEYEFPFTIDDIAVLNGVEYFRSGDDVYKLDDTVSLDDGVNYDFEAQLAFVNAKKPGINKYWSGYDVVFSAGSGAVSFKYNPNIEAQETIAVRHTGDTSGDELNSLELVSPSISPVIKDSTNQKLQFDRLILYFDPLGTT